jgi:hypothetical protein
MNWKFRAGTVAVTVALGAALGAFGGAAIASADFKFEKASVSLTNPDGSFEHRSGGHPDLRFDFTTPFGSRVTTEEEYKGPIEAVRDALLALPPGMIGNPTAAPLCNSDDFLNGTLPNCPVASQIGTVTLYLSIGTSEPVRNVSALYNIAHGPNVPARFGFVYFGVASVITPSVRPGDYGISSGSINTSQGQGIQEVSVKLWGVPASPAHDTERAFRGSAFIFGIPIPANTPEVPFMRTPTSCSSQPEAFTASGDSWEHPGVFDVRTLFAEQSGTPFYFEGCKGLAFEPSFAVQTSSAAAGSPTGLVADITVPQDELPTGRATSDVRKVVTTLPLGMAVSDSSAQGLGSCSVAQIGIGSNDPPTCPESSKIGTVSIKTPLLEEELQGGVYLAKQNENPFGSTVALYLGVKGPGFYLKLPGKVDADPNTGQLTATFDNTPQLPFEHLRLELKSGPRAPLTLPRKCGTYAVKSEIIPWSGTAPVVGESKFQVSENCSAASQFKPGLKAGTANPQAGSYSPFTLQVTRADGEQNLSSIKASLPEGLLAKLAGVPVCGDAQAASGDCPAASQVGTATVGAGPGPTPVFVPEAGKAPTAVYLAGPYKGAPYSLVVKVPAQAGPFDLGTVSVRNALRIDPVTTQVTTESDPLPQILEGIPVAYRNIRVEINRPDFTINPTNCEAKKVAATIGGAEGASATPFAPFAAANCAALGLQPKLAIKFSGAPTRRGGHPKLTATLTTKKGDSNLKRVQVTLPKTEFLENAHIKTVCTRVQYAADQCPKASIYGHAKAWTPLLDKPLEGPVYLRSSNHTLPDLVASLDGQIHVDLDGRIDSVHARIRNTFEMVPDAPVTKFVLTMAGGGKGLLVNNTQLCSAQPRSKVVFNGQNGKTETTEPLVSVGGCGGGGKKKPKKK